MTCSNGVCAPTANSAVLNVGDLETDLASGNVKVTTTGAGVQADNINVESPLSWATANALALDAHRSISVNAPISVVGQSGVSLQTGARNGTLSFGKKGSVGFSVLSSNLTINGVAYQLVGNITTLAAHIASKPSGAYALAGTYDASADGTYGSSPIETVFTGTFEGLGNNILNFSINGASQIDGAQVEGFFAETGAKGTLRDFGLVNANVQVAELNGKDPAGSGALVGLNTGTIQSCLVTGKVNVAGAGKRTYPLVGGLIGSNSGKVENSFSAADVTGKTSTAIGGLVSLNGGTINKSHAAGAITGEDAGGLVAINENGTVTGSYATGNVHVVAAQGHRGEGGGLVASTVGGGSLSNTYATGTVTVEGSAVAFVGGLVGNNGEAISFSYSTGAVSAGTGSYVGGLIGNDGGTNNDNDWDTDTSGITNLSQGAGYPTNDPGITGLSTAQFQSGLPTGFDPTVWREKPNINGGLPYLLANPPAK